ncbi:MAG: tetratricopeptide repeat protein [Bacteroidetes bacterium]|nr:tetratricopeptide repeat protein [Bacteroidota bacterium]
MSPDIAFFIFQSSFLCSMLNKLYFAAGIFSLFVVLSVFSSCKQCNQTQQPVEIKKDLSSNPPLEMLNQQIQLDSLNPLLYFKRAKLHEANNDLKSSATDMYLALMLDSLRPEYYLYASDIFKKMGEPQKGIALMEKAIATDSFNIHFYVKAAELAYIDTTMQGNYQTAMSYLNTAIDKDPQNADIYFYKGNVYKEAGDTLKALSSFQTATELNPKHYDAFVQIGLLLEKRKDKNASKYLDNAIRVGEKPEDALYAKANMYKEDAVDLQEEGKDAKAIEKYMIAIENFKKVIEVNHRNVEAYMGAAFSYYQMDSLDEAHRYYGLAYKLDPTYAGAYFSQGLVSEEMGRKQEAISLYQNCLNIDPNFKRASEHLKKLQVP